MWLASLTTSRRLLILLGILAGSFLLGGSLYLLYLERDPDDGEKSAATATDAAAVKAGKQLSNDRCSGEGPVTLSASPMEPEDFTIYIPYGLMVGGHVTPIDHAYFSPKAYDSPPNAYEVRAMADGRLVEITTRQSTIRGQTHTEYRMVFSHTCTFLTYYDLVTELEPSIETEFERKGRSLDIPVKAGQPIGRIGGRTLDFAVWDTTKPLSGFINPKSYSGEEWKIYTADPYPYLSSELRALLLERNPRTVEPIAGRIDYDVDGRLAGNWFLEGTTYQNNAQGAEGYWRGHLAFAPNHFDPSVWMASLGDWPASAANRNQRELQAVLRGNSPLPTEVGVGQLTKYELVQGVYTKADGSNWDQMSVAKGPKLKEGSFVVGTVLVQLTEQRKLKFESFPGKMASQVSGFTGAAKMFTR